MRSQLPPRKRPQAAPAPRAAGTPMTDAEYADHVDAARDQFIAGFHRNQNRNLTREYEGKTVTVFRRPGGWSYRWCIGWSWENKKFSSDYATERDALDAVAAELAVGE